jgi:hypothetical protein
VCRSCSCFSKLLTQAPAPAPAQAPAPARPFSRYSFEKNIHFSGFVLFFKDKNYHKNVPVGENIYNFFNEMFWNILHEFTYPVPKIETKIPAPQCSCSCSQILRFFRLRIAGLYTSFLMLFLKEAVS